MRIHDHATIEDFYKMIQENPLVGCAFPSNNRVYKVELRFYDGNKPLVFVFESPQGYMEDQRKRRGVIELITGE